LRRSPRHRTFWEDRYARVVQFPEIQTLVLLVIVEHDLAIGVVGQ